MKIPPDAIIPMEKLTQYLLVWRAKDDKSKFLAQAGFQRENPEVLLKAIQELIEQAEAIQESSNDYGVFFRIEGDLRGPNEKVLAVITIWLRWNLDNSFHFVTLKPRKDL